MTKNQADKNQNETQAMVPANQTSLGAPAFGGDNAFSIPTEWGDIDVKDLLDRGFVTEQFCSMKEKGSVFYGVYEKEGAGIERAGMTIPTFHFHAETDERIKAFILGAAQITAKLRNANEGDTVFITRIGETKSSSGHRVGDYRIFVQPKGLRVIDTTATTKK